MALTEDEKREYGEHRLEMLSINRNFRLIFWGLIVLTAVFVVMIFMTGIVETKKHEGASIWYYSMESGMLEGFFAIVTLAAALIVGLRNKAVAYVQLGIYLILFFLAILHIPVTLSVGNVIPALLGIGLSGWQVYLLMRLGALSELPGYPLFSEHASEPAHFETIYHVKRAQPAGSAMQDTSGAGGSSTAAARPAFGTERPHAAGVSEASLGIGEMNGSASMRYGDRAEALQAADVALDSMGGQVAAGKAEQQPAALAEVLLDDMSAEGSAASKQYAPDADALPTPEEVRARLAAMKQARNNPPQK